MDNFWTDELVAEYGIWYKDIQGNPPLELWGKSLLKHFKQSKQPKPILTTEDGKEIYSGDTFYFVNKTGNEFTVFEQIAPSVAPSNPNYSKTTFSTKEKAEEYKLLNQPCLSVNDVLSADALDELFYSQKIVLESIKKLASQKQNTHTVNHKQ